MQRWLEERKEVGKKASWRCTTCLALSATQTQHMGHVSPSALNFSLNIYKNGANVAQEGASCRQGRNICLICSKPAIKNNHIVAGLPTDPCFFSFRLLCHATVRCPRQAGVDLFVFWLWSMGILSCAAAHGSSMPKQWAERPLPGLASSQN